jgi:hypothetical protein
MKRSAYLARSIGRNMGKPCRFAAGLPSAPAFLLISRLKGVEQKLRGDRSQRSESST